MAIRQIVERIRIHDKKDDNQYTLTRKPLRRFDSEESNTNCFAVVENEDAPQAIVNVIKDIKNTYRSATCDDFYIVLVDGESYIYDLIAKIKQQIFHAFEWTTNVAHETKEQRKGEL